VIFLYFEVSRPALGSTQPYIHCLSWSVSLGVKQQGHEADHSPPGSAKLKNGGAILHLSISFNGVVLN
jgi:hypothetical protein